MVQFKGEARIFLSDEDLDKIIKKYIDEEVFLELNNLNSEVKMLKAELNREHKLVVDLNNRLFKIEKGITWGHIKKEQNEKV